MTKVSRETKLKAVLEYKSGSGTTRSLSNQYGFSRREFRMLIAAFESFGAQIILKPPTVTPEFRYRVTVWAIENQASYTQIAKQFGYTVASSIYNWKKIYFQNGRDGLMSLVKGRPNTMTKKNKSELTAEQRLQQVEQENLHLRIENDALKLLASMEQRDQQMRDSRK